MGELSGGLEDENLMPEVISSHYLISSRVKVKIFFERECPGNFSQERAEQEGYSLKGHWQPAQEDWLKHLYQGFAPGPSTLWGPSNFSCLPSLPPYLLPQPSNSTYQFKVDHLQEGTWPCKWLRAQSAPDKCFWETNYNAFPVWVQ